MPVNSDYDISTVLLCDVSNRTKVGRVQNVEDFHLSST